MRVARKFVLAVVLAVTAVLAVHGYVRLQRLSALLDREGRRDHQLLGRALALGMQHVWAQAGERAAVALVDEMNASEPEIELRFVWTGRPVGASDRPVAPESVLAPLALHREVMWIGHREGAADTLYTYFEVRIAGVQIGAIELSESRASDEQFLRSSRRNTILSVLITALAAGLAVAALGVVVVGRRVRTLVDQAARIGSGEFTRLPSLGRDEIGDLGVAMNAMSDQLASARDALQAQTAARLAAQKQLEHADRLNTVGKLGAGIAHELGTPLNVISQRAQMIATREVTGDAACERAAIIVDQADRMAMIIRELLDFARRREPRKTSSDLTSIAHHAVALLRPLGEKRGAKISLADTSERLRADVDASQVQQALANLVVNAIDAMPNGGEIEVDVHARETDAPADVATERRRWGAITVRDNGSGIDPDQLGSIFEPFVTTKAPGEGTGLGLSVAYGLIRDHGGWIGVTSTPGTGSEFTVFLPIEEDA